MIISNNPCHIIYGLPESGTEMPQDDAYGYSGKEFTTTKGLNFYDFGARTYVPDEGRFWQPDPKAEICHGISPYAYCAGDPINKIDPTGEIISVIFGNDVYTWQNLNGLWSFYNSQGSPYEVGSDMFIDRIIESLHFAMSKSTGRELVEYLAYHENILELFNLDIPNPPKRSDGTIIRTAYGKNKIGIDYSHIETVPIEAGTDANIHTNLAHELAHARFDWMELSKMNDTDVFSLSEVYTTHIENKIRAEHNLPLRTYYEKNEFNRGSGERLIIRSTRESRFVDKQEKFSKKKLRKGFGYIY